MEDVPAVELAAATEVAAAVVEEDFRVSVHSPLGDGDSSMRSGGGGVEGGEKVASVASEIVITAGDEDVDDAAIAAAVEEADDEVFDSDTESLLDSLAS